MITRPTSYPADNEAVLRLLRLLDNVRLTDFVDDAKPDLGKYGLANPSLAITLYAPDHKDGQTLAFGYVDPKVGSNAVYSRTGTAPDDPVYTVTKDVFASADVGYDDLRDKTVVRFDPSKVSRVTLTGAGLDETVERHGKNQWLVTADGKSAPAEQPVVQSLLDQLHTLTAKAIVEDNLTDPQRYGMVTPAITIAMFDDGGKSLGVVRASLLEITTKPQSSDEKVETRHQAYATTSLDSDVYQIEPQAVQDLRNTADRLHSDAVPTPTPSPTSSPTAHPSASPAASPVAPH
jgi:hypothetical protein